MFICNAKDVIQGNVYQCSVIVGEYLISKGIPLLSREDKYMTFAYTQKLQEELDDMPLYLKILIKGGVVNG